MEAPARGYPGLEAARPVVLEKSFSSFGVYMDYLFSPFAVLKPLFIYIFFFKKKSTPTRPRVPERIRFSFGDGKAFSGAKSALNAQV